MGAVADAIVAYEAIKAINWSSLKWLAVSPLMYRWRLEHPQPRKDAYVFGGAVHTLILEPEKFSERYDVFDGTRNEKHEKWQTWQKEHPDVEALKQHEMKRVREVAAAVLSHRIAGPLLEGGRREEIVTWTDEATGLACKGRIDYLRPDFLLDLKSTPDPSPAKFVRDAASFGYSGQLGFYHDGATRARLIDGRHRPYIIAPQKVEPYDVAVYQLDAEALVTGRVIYRSLLERLVQCTDADYWPGVAPELQTLTLPPWAADKFVLQVEDEEEF
jgi:hypothetical protein